MEDNYFAHDTAIVDEGCDVASGTKIWHFSHIMTGCKIGENCNIGQKCCYIARCSSWQKM